MSLLEPQRKRWRERRRLVWRRWPIETRVARRAGGGRIWRGTARLAAGVISLVLLHSCATLQADLLCQVGSEEVWVGHLRQRTGQRIDFQVESPTGELRDLSLTPEQVLFVQETIPRSQLLELRPAEPEKYLELADELWGWPSDYLARRMARRLYVIACQLADEQNDDRLQLAAIWGLWCTMENAADKQRLEVLAHRQLLPARRAEFDRRVIEFESELGKYRDAFRQLISHPQEADPDTLNLPQWELLWGMLPVEARWATIREAIESRRLSDFQQRQLWIAELALLSTPRGQQRRDVDPEGGRHRSRLWPRVSELQQAQSASIVVAQPTLRNLTGFDPAACLYRNGEWVVELDRSP